MLKNIIGLWNRNNLITRVKNLLKGRNFNIARSLVVRIKDE
jgi:hypothetical protein